MCLPFLVRSFLEGPERPAARRHDVAALDQDHIYWT
jgi:hypothetical protein